MKPRSFRDWYTESDRDKDLRIADDGRIQDEARRAAWIRIRIYEAQKAIDASRPQNS